VSDNNTSKKTLSQVNASRPDFSSLSKEDSIKTFNAIKNPDDPTKCAFSERLVSLDQESKGEDIKNKTYHGIDHITKKEVKVGDKEPNPYDVLNNIFGVKVIKDEDLVSKTYDIIETKYDKAKRGYADYVTHVKNEEGKPDKKVEKVRQMSPEWIDDRLNDKNVKNVNDPKNQISTAYELGLQNHFAPGTVSKQLAHVHKDGTIKYETITKNNMPDSKYKKLESILQKAIEQKQSNTISSSQYNVLEATRQGFNQKQSNDNAVQVKRSNNQESKNHINRDNDHSTKTSSTSASKVDSDISGNSSENSDKGQANNRHKRR